MKCDKCDEEAVAMIGPIAYCQKHYDEAEYR